MTKENVLEALRNVQEPDLGKDIVTLNMVKDIVIEGKYISFTIVLTTPACPLKDLIKKDCISAIQQHANEEAVINVIMLENAAQVQMITEAAGDPGEEFPRADIEKLKQEVCQPEQFIVNFNYLARRVQRRA